MSEMMEFYCMDKAIKLFYVTYTINKAITFKTKVDRAN